MMEMKPLALAVRGRNLNDGRGNTSKVDNRGNRYVS
jgi:hypothetical protein